MSEHALVTVRYRRWPFAVGWLVSVAFEAGLLVAIWRAVVHGQWEIEGVGAVGTVFGWALVFGFALLMGLAVVVGARLVLMGAVVDHVGDASVWETTGARETARVDLATAQSITYLPGLRATWQRSGKAADQRTRWTPVGVGYDRLVVTDRSGAHVDFSSSAPHWPDVVNTLETWTARTPALAADPETQRFLSTPYPRPHSRLARWAGPVVTMLLVAAAELALVAHWDRIELSLLPGVALCAVLFGAVVWWGLVRSFVAVVEGVVASIRRRDPWAAFLPDEHGRYNWLIGARTTVLQAPARRSLPALLWRWPMFVLIGAVPTLLVVGITRPLW